MMAHVMSNFTLETGNSLDRHGSGGGHQGSSLMSGRMVYIVGGGAAAAGGVLLMLVMVMGARVWRRRRDRGGRYETDAEAGQGRGEVIYDEIAEGKGGKKKKKKKKGKKTATKHQNDDDPDNNNDVGGSDQLTMDTAPDIITAHDNESIYETLDGRRAARAKAAHVTLLSQSEDCNDCACDGHPGCHPDFSDSTYDHLNGFNKPRRSPRLPPSVPEKRFTDPEVVTRAKACTAAAAPRAVHSADCAAPGKQVGNGGDPHCKVWAKNGCKCNPVPVESPSGTLTSSLTEMAQQSVSGGKRIVCQLTMVGVVENGKPVPVKPAAASNAYFILERGGRDPAERDEGGTHRSPSPAKFRFKTEACGVEKDQGASASSAAAGTDYFILEPLGQREDLKDFEDVTSSRASLSGEEECQTLDTDVLDDSQCSVTDSGRMRRQESFRNTRVSSCPGHCSFTTDADESSPSTSSSPSKHNKYARSLSSPQSSQHRRNHREDNNSIHKKMDSDLLKAQIRKEMIAFGFLNGPDDQGDDGEKTSEMAATCHSESQNSEEMCSPVKPATNNYFLLEPQLDASMEESNAGFSTPISPQSCEHVEGEKSRFYQRRQPPSHPHPPPLPKRNGHSRSKSEAPAVECGGSSPQPSGHEQGPVIVSLKKHGGELSQSGHAIQQDSSSECLGSEEAFRPRFKSESGIMSGRPRRC